MLNRGLTCVTRPTEFDLWREQQVDPVSGYGIIPLLAAAGGVGLGFLDSKAKKKQAKKDAKAEKAEIARQQAAMEKASRNRQMAIVGSVAGLAVVGAIIFAMVKSRKKR